MQIPPVKQYREAKLEFERNYVHELLTMTMGDCTLAAQIAGIHRERLYDKARRYGLKLSDYKLRAQFARQQQVG